MSANELIKLDHKLTSLQELLQETEDKRARYSWKGYKPESLDGSFYSVLIRNLRTKIDQLNQQLHQVHPDVFEAAYGSM